MNLAYSSASRLGVPNCGVPNWGYSSASRIGGSQIEGFQRVPNELFIKVQVSGGVGECVCAHVVQRVPTGIVCIWVGFSASRMSGVWNRVYSSASRMSGGMECSVLSGIAARPVRGPMATGCIDENLGFS